MKCSVETGGPIRAILDAIEAMSLHELETHWQGTFGCPRPKGVKRRFLQRALAYRVQAKRSRGLSRRFRQFLMAGRLRVLVANAEFGFVVQARLMRGGRSRRRT